MIFEPKINRDKKGYEYLKGVLLGRGEFGAVFLFERFGQIQPNPFSEIFYRDSKVEGKKFCAIKRYHTAITDNEGINFSALREINLLLTLDHPNIVTAYEVRFIRNRLEVVMDFFLQLTEVIHSPKINYNEKRMICWQITKGLEYLHRHYIFHRDLKPQNIFIGSEGLAKIGDFGFSKQFGNPNQKFTPYVCTKEYRAPQLFLRTNYYTEKTDIWALGCVFYYVLTGQTLFSSKNPSDTSILALIFALTGTPNAENWPQYKKMPKYYEFHPFEKQSLSKEKGVSEEIGEIIQLCIQLDPKKRPSARQLLTHPFFNFKEQQQSEKSLLALQGESIEFINELFSKKLEKFNVKMSE